MFTALRADGGAAGVAPVVVVILVTAIAGCYRSHEPVARDGGGAAPDARPTPPPRPRSCAAGMPCDCRAVSSIPVGVHWQGMNVMASWPINSPAHRVELTRRRWLATYEATAGCYHRCLWEGGCNSPRWSPRFGGPRGSPGFAPGYWVEPANADLPIFDLTRRGAEEYCAWLGGRLPTDVEWERAARGTNGRCNPWEPDPAAAPHVPSECPRTLDRSRAHYAGLSRPPGWDGPYDWLVPVDAFPAGIGPYGHLQLIGNVAEWVMDSAVPYDAEPDSLRVEPAPAVDVAAQSVVRGTPYNPAWVRIPEDEVPLSSEPYPYGVRCIFDEPPEPLLPEAP